jgi:hypothetical protein
VWSLDLTIYHSVVSIAIPIFIVEYIFPDRKNTPWLRANGVRLFSFLLLAVVLFGYLALTTYRPPALQYWMACLVMAGLILAARHLPATWPMGQKSMAKKPLWFGLFGFATIAVFYILLMFDFPKKDVPVGTTIFATILLLGICYGVVRYLSGVWSWAERHKLALVSGVLAFFVFLAPLQERDAARPDDTTGMTWVGILLAIFLFWLQRRGARKKSISEGEFAESDG